MDREPHNIYSNNIGELELQLKARRNQLRLLSMARLLSFGLMTWLVIESFRQRFAGDQLIYAAIFFILFLLLVFRAMLVKRKMEQLTTLKRINVNELDIMAGKDSFLDDGATHRAAGGFTVDLNIFGRRSLFHLLNRAGSRGGIRELAHRLSHPFYDASTIRMQQDACRDLAPMVAFRQQLLARCLLLNEPADETKLQFAVDPSKFAKLTRSGWKMLSFIWPIGAAILIVFSAWTGNYSWLLLYLVVGLFIIAIVFKEINLLYYSISKSSYLFTQYGNCFDLINEQSFKADLLLQKQHETKDAAAAFKWLSSITGVFDLRMSLFSLFINGLFLSDLSCARAYLAWSSEYGGELGKWFDALAAMESLGSLSTFHFNHPSFVFPGMQDELAIRAHDIGHPLMDANKAVLNDINIGDESRLHIITGSNMSGKSTYLRTIGLNLLLAQTGAPVFAKTFSFRPMRILTSFHHIDSLEESTSYFFAELKALQSIVQSLGEPVPALVLLDEVMRGTNSQDKHDGTALLIKKLLQFHCLSLLATHDTALGELQQQYPDAIENYCFESELDDQGLHFDFRHRPGVAQTRNATYLMRKMGIV